MKTPKASTIINRLLTPAIAAVILLLVPAVQAQQASLSLENGDLALCYGRLNAWGLTKSVDSITGTPGNQTVTWTVTATKGAVSGEQLLVSGYLTVKNGGSADATIGNIVVNLQQRKNIGTPSKPRWIWASASATVADATNGNAATSAHIVAAASQEDPTHSGGAYTVSGARGTFTENAAAGPLQLLDLNANDLWAISPQQTIPPGESVHLVFKAQFDASLLAITEGTALRAEVIVSFGNAGRRGGGSASAAGIDINGNGTIDTDEAWVRSVPTRITEDVPAFEDCHAEVLLDDPGVTATGTVTFGEVSIDGLPLEPVSSTTTFTVTATGVNGGASGGYISNTATLSAEGSEVSLLVGTRPEIDPITGLPTQAPVYYTFLCCPPLHLTASASAQIGQGGGFQPGDYCSFSQGGLGGSGAPFLLLASNFNALFPAGVEVGFPGSEGYSMKFSSALAVKDYLPAGGTPDQLTADLLDPTSSSSGVFGGQVLALKLNIMLSDGGATPPGLGDLFYINPGDALHGLTVRQILAAAELALGGGPLPEGHTYASLSTLCDHLNLSWHVETSEGCGPSAWALLYLSNNP
jgi:hypothetical protein